VPLINRPGEEEEEAEEEEGDEEGGDEEGGVRRRRVGRA
jgi:hypothetical protein